MKTISFCLLFFNPTQLQHIISHQNLFISFHRLIFFISNNIDIVFNNHCFYIIKVILLLSKSSAFVENLANNYMITALKLS